MAKSLHILFVGLMFICGIMGRVLPNEAYKKYKGLGPMDVVQHSGYITINGTYGKFIIIINLPNSILFPRKWSASFLLVILI
jgi:hypothetical protein